MNDGRAPRLPEFAGLGGVQAPLCASQEAGDSWGNWVTQGCTVAGLLSVAISRCLCWLLVCEDRMKLLPCLLLSMSSVIFSRCIIPLVAVLVRLPLVAGNKGQAFVGRMLQGSENRAELGKGRTKVALG